MAEVKISTVESALQKRVNKRLEPEGYEPLSLSLVKGNEIKVSAMKQKAEIGMALIQDHEVLEIIEKVVQLRMDLQDMQREHRQAAFSEYKQCALDSVDRLGRLSDNPRTQAAMAAVRRQVEEATI